MLALATIWCLALAFSCGDGEAESFSPNLIKEDDNERHKPDVFKRKDRLTVIVT